MRPLELSAPLYARRLSVASSPPARGFVSSRFRQLLRFGAVGFLNTLIDLLALNMLFWLFPTRNSGLLLVENSIAYSVGAVNSFFLNKYWTFRCAGRARRQEVGRFALTTLAGVLCNNLLLWLMSSLLHPVFLSALLWANASKLLAIGGTVLLSYLGMRLWVFAGGAQELAVPEHVRPVSSEAASAAAFPAVRASAEAHRYFPMVSLSAVLPIYNEATTIAETVEQVTRGAAAMVRDVEIILVNDGSTDGTGAILAALAAADPRIRLVVHERNQGYGAALADGFAAATKPLTFFMDADGQFAIDDLARLLPFMRAYDAVIGYRLARQDSWLRRLNAWGWKLVVRMTLGVWARDIDCAFKLLRTSFLQGYPLETRGAMINAELLYKLRRAGCVWQEVGVRHFPRRGGRATGANLRVILRAFRELFSYARLWHHQEKACARLPSNTHQPI